MPVKEIRDSQALKSPRKRSSASDARIGCEYRKVT